MSPTDTPRTERFIDSCGDYEKWRSYRDRLHEFARSLERENAALVKERDELLEALRTSTNGLRHCSRWNISEETEKAIITQVIANELILDKYKEAE